jgi:hypothetical protein
MNQSTVERFYAAKYFVKICKTPRCRIFELIFYTEPSCRGFLLCLRNEHEEVSGVRLVVYTYSEKLLM